MIFAVSKIPLQWRVFLATSITITILFAVAGWGLQHYALSVADESVRTGIQASIQAYEAVWKARTQVLSATSALMSTMSDVRRAFNTRDEKTIQDSAQDLWSRVSDQSAVFLVLDAQGHLIASLGKGSSDLSPREIPLAYLVSRFPKQVSGYLREESKLFYLVLTPVYVQTSGEPLLLNVLCAGFRIDNAIAEDLKRLAPGSDFAFLDREHVFASTLGRSPDRASAERVLQANILGPPIQQNQFVISGQRLDDVTGKPVAELRILHSYAAVAQSLSNLRRSLGLAWFATIAMALLLSLFTTRRLLEPVTLLDHAAAEIAARNYRYRIPVKGADDLSRLAATFNEMCDSIEKAQAELIRQEQFHTIDRLATSLVHDLRNPLAAIYGGAEMLIDGMPPDQMRRVATNIYRASNRVQELLRDLLNASRGEPAHAEPCKLREIIEAAAESSDVANSNVRIRIAVDETPELMVSRTRMERVFMNLLSNAVDAMPEGGDISISAKREEDHLTVFVEDTGPGVPAQIRAQLFQPFVTAGKRTGLGLGLSLSRQTMLELGGDLQFVHRNGTGACFHLRFPKTSLVPASVASEPATLPVPRTGD
ncbi:MAG: HAMP domain-containing protein [Acidobacteriaceae bacterium]|nr:HAMP domain-containing protein [Acidobacteriaceae bacterium]MBV9295802.1 HAMP domain-containing protein [Acidobacteriaceae bacterium]MBV9763922.1 HAMP domain-containing protein [Acidobacteriaceae bacterium]